MKGFKNVQLDDATHQKIAELAPKEGYAPFIRRLVAERPLREIVIEGFKLASEAVSYDGERIGKANEALLLIAGKLDDSINLTRDIFEKLTAEVKKQTYEIRFNRALIALIYEKHEAEFPGIMDEANKNARKLIVAEDYLKGGKSGK